jgi:hypothetical protein
LELSETSSHVLRSGPGVCDIADLPVILQNGREWLIAYDVMAWPRAVGWIATTEYLEYPEYLTNYGNKGNS